MKKLNQGFVALLLASLIAVVMSGGAYASVEPAAQQSMPSAQVAQKSVLSFDSAHPLEYYLALPVEVYAQQAQTPLEAAPAAVAYRDSAHPLEYYLALPIVPDATPIQVTYRTGAHPLEYYLAFPTENLVAQDYVTSPAVVGGKTSCSSC